MRKRIRNDKALGVPKKIEEGNRNGQGLGLTWLLHVLVNIIFNLRSFVFFCIDNFVILIQFFF